MGRASTWKNLEPAVPRVLLSEIFGEPCLTWSDRRKNKPIKQEPKTVGSSSSNTSSSILQIF